MPAPRVAKLSGTITWSDGSNFNGYGVVGLIFPTSGGIAWPAITIEPNNFRQEIPTWSTIPISDGTFNQNVGLWFTNDINPPGTKYALWIYDAAGKLVGEPTDDTDFFTVTADPTTPPTYTLTVPTSGISVPDPGEGSVALASGFSIYFVDGEVPTGTINSTTGTDGNGTFTLVYTPNPATSLRLYRNGVQQLVGTDFTLSNDTITYASGKKPVTGDWHVAFYRRSG